MTQNFELQALEGDIDSPERILYGEIGHLPEVDEDDRRGYIFDIGKHNPSKKARMDVEVSEVTFSDAYEAMVNDEFEELTRGTAVSSSMYGEEFNPEDVAEDLVRQIEKYGLEGGAEPPEGYEVTVSNPE